MAQTYGAPKRVAFPVIFCPTRLMLPGGHLQFRRFLRVRDGYSPIIDYFFVVKKETRASHRTKSERMQATFFGCKETCHTERKLALVDIGKTITKPTEMNALIDLRECSLSR